MDIVSYLQKYVSATIAKDEYLQYIKKHPNKEIKKKEFLQDFVYKNYEDTNEPEKLPQIIEIAENLPEHASSAHVAMQRVHKLYNNPLMPLVEQITKVAEHFSNTARYTTALVVVGWISTTGLKTRSKRS